MLDHLPAHVMVTAARPELEMAGHARWVRVSHWLLTASILTLAFTGFVILMAHPRLYWGDTGNDLTPALIELPISRNHRHGGWADRAPLEGRRRDQRQPDLRDLQRERLGTQPALLAAWFWSCPARSI